MSDHANDKSGYDLIAEVVSLTGLPESESTTRLLLEIIKSAKLDAGELSVKDLRFALTEYLQKINAAEKAAPE